MAKGFIDTILDKIFDSNWVGKRGEKLIERELKLVGLLGRNGKILRNIYVPKNNGETSEIDVLYICQKGIFVIESKNYSGWIFGSEKVYTWTALLPNKKKNKFYNPIKQNQTHIKWLSKYLEEDIPMFSLIVFSERCELKKVTIESSDIYVFKRDLLYATIRKIWNQTEDVLDDIKINDIYCKLKASMNADQETKAAHIERINTYYKDI